MRGQALAEGLLGLAALGLLFWAVPLMGRYQDIVLSSAQASAHAAFLATRDDFADDALARSVAPMFAGTQGSRWRDARGQTLLVASAGVGQRRVSLDDAAQPGGAGATTLRRDWGLEDKGVRVVSVGALARDLTQPGQHSLRLARATAVMVDAGHAASPVDVQSRLAGQGPGWRVAQTGSAALARVIGARAALVDAGWRRSRVQADWLSDWADLVPADRVTGAAP